VILGGGRDGRAKQGQQQEEKKVAAISCLRGLGLGSSSHFQ
jgi:hypothetical protein